MRRPLQSLGFAACLILGIAAARAELRAPPDPAANELQARLAAGTAAGETLISLPALRRFYEERGRRFAWSEEGRIPARVETLLAALRNADREGLRRDEYHTAAIDALLARLRPATRERLPAAAPAARGDAADLDVLLSDAFFLYATHLTAGRVQPRSVEPEWNIEGRGRDLVFLLAAALANDHLAETLDALPPVREDYRLLRDALAARRAAAAAGAWAPFPDGPALRAGDRGARVELLRRRLAAGGDLPSGAAASADSFDDLLAQALRSFQARHGLDPDGVAGRRTIAALDTPPLLRVRQIEANLERLRWLPRDFGPRHILVNIADFSLALTETGLPTLEMRVIVGRQVRRTPFFTGEITSIQINPGWIVPEKIAVEDKLPLILEDSDYLADHGFKVFAPAAGGWREIDPAQVDWTRLSAARFPYRLRQEPGPHNALGRVKFQFPNRHDIYLHDTPAHELFSRTTRDFSSGCIRVARAVDLAERLLAADPAWTRVNIEAAIEAGATVKALLPQPLPVYLLYFTAWVDGAGALQLREDVYGRDDALLEALARPLAAP